MTEQATTQTTHVISVTEGAAKRFVGVLEGKSNPGIRVGVTGGGCAGLQYDLKPCEDPQDVDIVEEHHGVTFLIHPMVVPYIKGTILDFSDDLMDGGFKFVNPNAQNSCGCGTSFGI